MDQFFAQTAVNMVHLLRKLGCKVHYNPNQTCCGQPAFNAGFWNEAEAVAEKWIQDFQNRELIVCPSGSCVGFARAQMGRLLDKKQDANYLKLRNSLLEFSDFLVNYLQKIDLGASLQGRAVYHDACAALRECQIQEAPRQLLRAVAGLELIEAPDAAVCCGFGGSFSAKFEPLALAMAEEKVQNALQLGADYIISTDASCLLHLQSYIDRQKLPIKTMHLADVLATAL